MLLSLALLSVLFAGCAGLGNFSNLEQMITRTEKDVYTLTQRDTAVIDAVRNAPGQRDNGVVYPTSRIVEMRRDLNQRDSVVIREYPNFIRLGLFETVGLIGSGSSANGLGGGLFGFMGYFDFDYNARNRASNTMLFPGGLYRIGIVEKRLRWFNDAPDWTLGTSIMEFIYGDSKGENQLSGLAPIYLRKRFYLREKIPYVTITPALGISLIPDPYINLSASADLGSLGGLNLRAYLGVAAGFGSKNTIPYFGLGTSVLDFLNRVPETETEWKYHEHSGWDIGLASVLGAVSNTEKPFFDPKTNTPFKGIIARIAPAHLALPFGNNRFYVGTALINFMLLGQKEGGLGIFPFRAGYWYPLKGEDLVLEPFAEYNYYPSSVFNGGVRLALRITNQINMQIQAGFATGSPIARLAGDFGNLTNFNAVYLGVGLGLYDRIFQGGELRYNRAKAEK